MVGGVIENTERFSFFFFFYADRGGREGNFETRNGKGHVRREKRSGEKRWRVKLTTRGFVKKTPLSCKDDLI